MNRRDALKTLAGAAIAPAAAKMANTTNRNDDARRWPDGKPTVGPDGIYRYPDGRLHLNHPAKEKVLLAALALVAAIAEAGQVKDWDRYHESEYGDFLADVAHLRRNVEMSLGFVEGEMLGLEGENAKRRLELLAIIEGNGE